MKFGPDRTFDVVLAEHSYLERQDLLAALVTGLLRRVATPLLQRRHAVRERAAAVRRQALYRLAAPHHVVSASVSPSAISSPTHAT